VSESEAPYGETWEQWLARYDAELVNYDGRKPNVAIWRGTAWVTDPRGEPWRELLVPLLGNSWLNVAESVRGSDVTGARILRGDTGEPFSQPLVRAVQTHALGELAVQDNDVAIASELAFCIWARRRDASAWNRAYVAGVPVFFDQHVAFEFCSLDTFLAQGPDGGYPSQWRVQLLGSGEVPTTLSERAVTDRDRRLAPHRVRDRSAFDNALDAAVTLIKAFDGASLAGMVASVGAPAEIGMRLLETQHELPHAISRIREILYL
jgi:hypothetical protein